MEITAEVAHEALLRKWPAAPPTPLAGLSDLGISESAFALVAGGFRVSTCAWPRSPTRVNAALASRNAMVSATASWCAASTDARTSVRPGAHSTLADFTGVNTRSRTAPSSAPR
jgi:hypothetical protein